MSPLGALVKHSFPNDWKHLHLVVPFVNRASNLTISERHRVCRCYVESGYIVDGKKLLDDRQNESFELLIENLVKELFPKSVKPKTFSLWRVLFVFRKLVE